MDIGNLQTPCLLLDRGRLESNIETMADKFKGLGVALRPHLKTPKSVDVARRLQAHGAERFTVSTLKEAEYFAGAGFGDLLYALSIVPDKLARVAALNRAGSDVAVCLDTVDGANTAAGTVVEGAPVRVFLEVDVDRHRTGLRPDEPRLLEIAKIVDGAAHLELAGVFAHAGESYHAGTIDEIREQARNEQALTRQTAEVLRQNGFDCPNVSVGSTPTATFGEGFDGITEARPGVYVFQDLFQANLGVCTVDDIAVSVLATVVTHHPATNKLVIDAGGLALSKDQMTGSQDNDCGYGLLTDADGSVLANLHVAGVSQEHGYVTTRDGSSLDTAAFPVGRKLRILPNHACMTAAAHEVYHVIENGAVTDTWGRVNGW